MPGLPVSFGGKPDPMMLRLSLSISLFLGCYSLNDTQLHYLQQWGVCNDQAVAGPTCAWVGSCYGNYCLNGELQWLEIQDYNYATFNESSRAGFALFPSVTRLTINWNGGSTVQIYPEIGVLVNLERIYFGPTVTGTIPNELGLLTQLNYFVIEKSSLTGTIPASFAQLPLEQFDVSGTNSDLHGRVPVMPNLTYCTVSTSTVYDNKGLFCTCSGPCRTSRFYNGCSKPCGTVATATCTAAVATLGYDYICTDACTRCGWDQCQPRSDNAVYICPGDPTSPPVESSEPRTTPTIDGNADQPSSSCGVKWVVL